MNIQLSWIAVKGGEDHDLLNRLGLEVAGETMWEMDQEFALGKTEQGWSILTMKDWPSEPGETMSVAAPVGASLYGATTSVAMFSELRAYNNGRPLWSVTRDCDKNGLTVHGAPPPPFDDIRAKLEAQQASAREERVDYLFDVPNELSASLCGYQPTSGIYEWQVLRRKTRATANPAVPPGPSLTQTMRAELLPLLWELGFRPAEGSPRLWPGGEIIRDHGEQRQTIWFEYSSGRDTYVDVLFQRNEDMADGSTWVETGRGSPAYVRAPWWKRFGFPNLEQSISTTVERAKADIRAIDAYLKSGVRGARIEAWARELPPTE